MLKKRTPTRKTKHKRNTRADRPSKKRRPKFQNARGPGKPTITNDELAGRRDQWAYALDAHWGEVGWNLRRARTIEHIRIALQPLSKGPVIYPLHLLLRSTTEASSRGALSEAKKALGVIVGRLYEAQDTQRNATEAFQKAKSAALEFGDKTREWLQTEIEKRRGNLHDLQIEVSGKNAEIRRKTLLLKKPSQQNRSSIEAELNTLQCDLPELGAEISTENGVIAELKRRRRLLTPENRKLADAIYAERKASLDAATLRFSEMNAEYKRLEGILFDLQAHYCQSGLLKLIRGKRYSHTPRKLANALAGLPTINCRQSATRCAKIPYTWEPICTVFEFVENTWRERDPSKSTPERVLDLFRNAIAALPKTMLVKVEENQRRKKADNYFRRDLCEKWFYLKHAIEEALRAYTHSDQVPYLITAKFKENVAKPRTAADELIAAQDKLDV